MQLPEIQNYTEYLFRVALKKCGNLHDADMPRDTYELTGLYLDPDYTGRGYGGTVIDWVKKRAAEMGCGRISLWVLKDNTRARRFYEKHGFAADGAGKNSGLGDTEEVRYIFDER